MFYPLDNLEHTFYNINIDRTNVHNRLKECYIMSEEERKSLIESIVDDILFLEKAETHDAINHCVLSSNEDMP